MNEKTKRIYSEVYELLNLFGDEYINKVPTNLWNMLKEQRDDTYSPQYIKNIPLYKQNIRKETIAILALLHLNYWCKDEKEKLELKQILKNNEDKYQQQLRERYNPDNIFKKDNPDKNTEEKIVQSNRAIILYKESMLRKIVKRIEDIFHRNKK